MSVAILDNWSTELDCNRSNNLQKRPHLLFAILTARSSFPVVTEALASLTAGFAALPHLNTAFQLRRVRAERRKAEFEPFEILFESANTINSVSLRTFFLKFTKIFQYRRTFFDVFRPFGRVPGVFQRQQESGSETKSPIQGVPIGDLRHVRAEVSDGSRKIVGRALDRLSSSWHCMGAGLRINSEWRRI